MLRSENEDILARHVVHVVRTAMRYPAAAVALWNAEGALEVRASSGYQPEESRVLERVRLTPEDLQALRSTARLAGSVGFAEGSHVLWGLGRLLFVVMHDVQGQAIGIILLGTGARTRLPRPHARMALELLAQVASSALLSFQQRRMEDERVRTIETQKRQLEALLQASANVHSQNLDDVLQRIASSMTSDGGFQRAAVYLRDQEDVLHARAWVGVPAEDVDRIRAPLPFSVFAHLMRPEMQISRSFLFDHRRHELPAELLGSLSIPEDRMCDPEEWHPLDSLTVPLQDRNGRTIGVVSLDEPGDRRYPDLATIQVLELFAGACAVAVEQARLYDEIQRLAMTDALTGLHNRRSFDDALRRELARVRRHGSPCSILFCDLDGLKGLNDTFGHDMGDQVLQVVAQVLRARLREGDLAARLGGDEFVLLLPNTRPDQGAVVAEELRGLVASLRPPSIPGGVRLSVSVGVAGLGHTSTLDQADLLRAADRALYEAKAAGRNRVQVA